MKIVKLYFRMLRYRVAIMLLIFFLLGTASHQETIHLSMNYLWAIIALISSYVAATTINDVADERIDAINHPDSRGRPLVTGEATKKDLYTVHFLAVALALVFSYLVSLFCLMIILFSLFINYVYSLPPLKISYRTYFAHLLLALAYVLIPYKIGLEVVGVKFESGDLLLILALIMLFLGRIILKDFRDRKGDALYGKPTFLLEHGKRATCVVSMIFVLLGNIALFYILQIENISIFIILELYFAAILFMLYKLSKEEDHEKEQVAIGIGAKMGNGLLLTLLGIYILGSYAAPAGTLIIFTLTISMLFIINFFFFLRDTNKVVIGYRG